MPRTQYARPLLGDPLRRLAESASLEQEAPEQESFEHEQPVAPSLRVGAVDDREELEADRVADRVLARLTGHHDGESETHEHEGDECAAGHGVRRAPGAGAVVGAAGGDLDTSSSAAIESARGGGSALPAGVRREMEAGFGHSLSDVRIHTDERAAGLSRRMSARAFTTGRDIFFDKGEFSPGTAEGKRVLAHEIAHTRQAGGVRRKLRGTADALLAQGDEKGDKGKSSGLVRKLTGKLTNWDKIVGAVRAYEAEEAKLLVGGKNPDPMTLMSAKPGMLKLLRKVQDYVADWRKANQSEAEDAKFDGSIKTVHGSRQNATQDSRSKAGRRQAVALLEPRVGNELRLLSAKDPQAWSASLGLSASQGTATGRGDKGQMNSVTEFAYQTESGDLTGFFKQDKGFNKDTQGHESRVGIRQVDPNYGARSVALYRLDQLFNARVTARAEFAVGTDEKGRSTLGTVLESAKGKSAAGRTYGMNREHTDALRSGGNAHAVALDDPVLQRGLNKLQILDAISGQLDRHMGNYYVDADEQGNVLSVTGIDLDMAFGANMKGVDFKDSGIAENYKELPDFIDEEMGLKILQVQPGDVRDALTGLLPKAEIDATLSRFRAVQTAVMEAQKNGRMRGSWNVSAVQNGAGFKDVGFNSARKTYTDNAMNGTRVDLLRDIARASSATISAAFLQRAGSWEDLPDDVPAALEAAFGTFANGNVSGPFDDLAQLIWKAEAGAQVDAIVARVVAEVMKLTTCDRVWIDIQEGYADRSHSRNAQDAMIKRIQQVVSSAASWIKTSRTARPRG